MEKLDIVDFVFRRKDNGIKIEWVVEYSCDMNNDRKTGYKRGKEIDSD